jgi:hypothetical protein
MNMEPEELYLLLGRLLDEMPDFSSKEPFTREQNAWLGRACALVEASGNLTDTATVKSAAQFANGAARSMYIERIVSVLHQTLASAELRAPVAARGAFIPAGNAFDAFAAIGKLLQSATADLLIVDPYMDATTLTEYAPLAREGCKLRLLADSADHKASLKPAVAAWTAQHQIKRPVEARLAPAKTLHDRLIIVDEKTAYTLTQSLNAFAARAHATIVRVDSATAALKASAYAEIWKAAAPL